jgi:hypothetical protein
MGRVRSVANIYAIHAALIATVVVMYLNWTDLREEVGREGFIIGVVVFLITLHASRQAIREQVDSARERSLTSVRGEGSAFLAVAKIFIGGLAGGLLLFALRWPILEDLLDFSIGSELYKGISTALFIVGVYLGATQLRRLPWWAVLGVAILSVLLVGYYA